MKIKKQAAINIFPFCIGMLITYYAVAAIKQGVYSQIFIIGWTIFAFFSPIMAVFVWWSKEKGLFPIVIRIGIIMISMLSSIILFDRLRIYDFIINGILIYFLFFKKIRR